MPDGAPVAVATPETDAAEVRWSDEGREGWREKEGGMDGWREEKGGREGWMERGEGGMERQGRKTNKRARMRGLISPSSTLRGFPFLQSMPSLT